MALDCNVCTCPDEYFRSEELWRKAVLLLLCQLIESIEALTAAQTPH
jgi:hypothetical protein